MPNFDVLRGFAEAADIDDRIRGIVVDVEDGCVDMLDPDRTSFASGYDSDASRVIRISRRRDGHRPWKIRRVFEPHSDTGLGIE